MWHQVSKRLFEDIADENTVRKVVSLYVMAPVMCMYVLWVLKEAMQSGKKRLYFLARDGYSMYQVAKVLCEQLNYPIECKYLYGSRYAWRSAEYHLLGEDCLSYICLGGIDVTLKKVMRRAGLTEEEGLQIAELIEKKDEYHKVLSYQQVRGLQPILADCEPFMELVKSRSEVNYPLVCGYLKQEGLTEGDWALVDSGWTGSMQKSVGHILESMGYEREVEGYYFGMYEYPQGMDTKDYHAWYFKPHSGIKRKVYFSNSLFECIFSSPEGMTLGYKQTDAGMEPVLEHAENANLEQIHASTEYLKQYALSLTKDFGQALKDRNKNDVKMAYELLRVFMGRPTMEEAREYGSYVFCDDVIGEENQTIASPLSYEEIKDNRFLYKAMNLLCKKGKAVHESAWLEGSVMLCPQAGSKELWHGAVYKYILYVRKLGRKDYQPPFTHNHI